MSIQQNQLSNDIELGGAGGGSDESSQLKEAELGSQLPTSPARIIDAFLDGTKGVRVNVDVVSSKASLAPGSITGTYTRTQSVSPLVASARGVANMDLRGLAPDNGQAFAAANPIVFDISGDVTPYITNGKKGMWVKEGTSDIPAVPFYQHLLNSSDIPYVFVITSAVYSVGPNKTTVTIANPDLRNFTMGVANTNHFAQLRLIPFDYKFEAYADGTTLQEMEIYKSSINGSVVTLSAKVPGVGQTTLDIGAITASANWVHTKKSPNGLYQVTRVYRNTVTADTVEWFYSLDRGVTWGSIGSKSTTGVNMGLDAGGWDSQKYQFVNDSQIVVANNGLMISSYVFGTGVWRVKGITANLAAGNLAAVQATFLDTPTTGAGVGIIAGDGASQFSGILAGDEIDLSFVACVHDRDDDSAGVKFFTAGGTVYDATSEVPIGTYNQANYYNRAAVMTGTGTSHRLWILPQNTSGVTTPRYKDQGAAPLASLAGVDYDMLGIAYNSTVDKIYAWTRFDYTQMGLRFYAITTAGFGGSPALGTAKILTDTSSNQMSDWSNGTYDDLTTRQMKTMTQKTRVDPANGNHLFAIIDVKYRGTHPNGITAPVLMEIENTADFKGIGASFYSGAFNHEFRINSGAQRMAQKVTFGAGTRVRTVGYELHRPTTALDIPAGYTMSVTIASDSAGSPGTELATSNTVDPSNLPKSTSDPARWVYFNFDNPAVDSLGAGDYWIIIDSNLPLNASTYIKINAAGSGTGAKQFDGAVWNISGAITFNHLVHGEWLTDIGNAKHADTSSSGLSEYNYESSIEFNEDGDLQAIWRKTFHSGVTRLLNHTGRPYRRIITINAGAISTKGPIELVGNDPADDDIDENLIFNVAMGADESDDKHTETGVLSNSGTETNDRSGFHHTRSSYAGTVTTDDDTANGFQIGSLTCNGSTTHVTYASSDALNLDTTKGLSIELEIKPTSVGGSVRALCNKSTAGNFWAFEINTSGFLRIRLGDSNDTVASDISEPLTYHKVRAIFNPSDRKFRLYRTTGSPHTAFTEVASYSAQPVLPATTIYGGAATATFTVGALTGGGGNFFDGKIGYFKMTKGTMIFAYNGFKSQPPMVDVQNLGDSVSGTRLIGLNSNSSLDTPFRRGVVASANAAGSISIVDAYPTQLYFKKDSFSVSGREIGFKATLGRKSDEDDSKLDGVNVIYES